MDEVCRDCGHQHSGVGTAAEWAHGPCFCGCMDLTKSTEE